ncbi:MerR family transcriptional regulator [Nonomuraea gerenzanensis]|uniref:HspR, transcriptional repressor of DnaK operon n=1 Tax=Nonomuraea gerenzanensis TaxID=93944 RepID=A0A1M4EL46_9ACTN|nr:MerR family transcriptional regulator [Nonomuraea gerenzanensis]UBU10847.1 MerR family transcriptional regulator [Nonomuraea gerenzanensis]SBO99283.1 HspR, transcriptional repressor of DnaK operon [Nonomuraea gerenzanensis]
MPDLPFDDEHAPLYSLGQVAEMLQVQQAFLRRLDQHDVIRPSRSSGGQRRYSRRDIIVVQHVTRMTQEGMTLIAIRRILELEREVAVLRRELKEARARLREQAGPDAR